MCENDVPEEIENDAADVAVIESLPEKSKLLYLRTFKEFQKWCDEKNIKIYTENVLVAYFVERSKTYKPSSLWCQYSMLKKGLTVNKKLEINKFPKLLAFLKRCSVGCKPKKSKILSREDIMKFIKEAPDDTYLMIKVALILGVAGACRSADLCMLMISDIQDVGSVLIIKLKERKFTVINDEENSINYVQIFRKYVSLRPKHVDHQRFFLWYKNGKCSTQPVGKNSFGTFPSKIASFLQLPEADTYTGHCFRRTSATLKDNGGDILTRKRPGVSHSSRITENYPQQSVNDNSEIAKKVLRNESYNESDGWSGFTPTNMIHIENIKVEPCLNMGMGQEEISKGMGEENGFLPTPKNFMTRAIHAGQEPEQWNSLAVIPPISMSTTFKQNGPGEYPEFDYGRSGNPTRKVLETCLANIEGGKYGLAFASGLGATTSVITMLNAGDHIISGDDIYGGTNRLFRQITARLGIEPSFVDTTDIRKVEAAVRPNTKLVWIETPTNPTMKVNDIKAVSEICKKHNLILVVDNSFLTPYLQRPLDFGADLVVYSITKYMNGHSDVVMGAVITSNEELHTKLRFIQKAAGVVPSPFDCFLVNRSLKTLGLRMKQHNKNGDAVANYLMSHPKVSKVLHPGLPCHPQHELFKRQTSGNSGMVSFYHTGGLEESKKLLKAFKVFTLAESLGGYESLAELPMVMTHASVPPEQLEELNITDNLIRLSVGLEDIVDLIADLSQALNSI